MARGKTVLVVDDSASVRLLVRESLEDAGFSVLEAENGQRGLAAAEERDVDLMIVDVNMPIMGGLEMIGRVRVLPAHKDTPIFVLTTESAQSTVKEGKAAGATAWLVKPVRPDLLVKAVRATLRV